MNTPLITIITVCFNAEYEIENTILSVINQTYPNIEYIIIDGGSIDGTIDIIKKYECSISYWISEPDKGIYDAMNKGLKLAKGEWVNFMNAGDVFASTESLNNIKFKLMDNSIKVIYSDNIRLYEGEIIGYRKVANINSIKYSMPFCHQSSLIRNFTQKKYLFDLQYRICADYNLFLDIYLNYGARVFKYIDVPISSFDLSGLSSKQKKESCIERMKIHYKNKLFTSILRDFILYIKIYIWK